MRHARALATLLLAILLGAAAAAQDAQPGTIRVASRLFLVGEGLSASDTQEDFLPLTRVPWAWQMIQEDPMLDGAVVHIERTPSPPAYLFSRERLAREFPDTVRVPDAFRISGYEVATTDGEVARMFLFRPDVPAPDFLVTCTTNVPLLPTDQPSFCALRASYPPDPAITLLARLYNPPPFAELHGRFEPIADRLRVIALCLDVTDSPPADPEAALAALLAENPRLEGCEDRLSS